MQSYKQLSKTFICNIVRIKLCNSFAVNYFLELFLEWKCTLLIIMLVT